MNFKKNNRKKDAVSVNLTSLIDVVLLLLIFFMISTTFVLTPGLKVDLPESTVEEVPQEKEDIIVFVTEDNRIKLGEEFYTYEGLYEELLKQKKEKPKANLIIQADEKANHGTVVEVMDDAKRTGFSRLSIATERRGE
ncbi:MAG: biopolymer transporter ExbD [Deltaproteobacteria bacterium]|uniref:Biopolymer transporter ExbD n=1 Tax=Candidatus Zymogenus saltonus TaxID=2844893 RepID=A0A9D8KF97_9DELT|nr:biopolymer transporter ExbD [Candidatus Zymogenus saltonus]